MKHAICNVTIAPIRAENNDRSEMISQLLFGEAIEIIEINDNWTLVKSLYDDYEGWVDSKQYFFTESIIKSDFMTLNISHPCQHKDAPIPLVLGCRLPNFDGLNFKIEKQKYIYTGKAVNKSINSLANLKKIALKYINAPYLWGGRSPFGIDCSGYTQMVFSFFNIKLPRDAYMQANIGETLNFVGETRLGDLAFFGKEENITHVGICLGKNEIIHASGKVRIDILDHIGIYNRETKKYTHFMKTIKRVI